MIGRTRHVTSPIWNRIDWLAGPKICIVGQSFADLEMEIKQFTLNFIYRCLGGVNINFYRIFQLTES